ncbi:stage 0 sporulation family protein [Saccharicrinis sp. FJH54]|uniref:PSP1 domain-containing protein n=1 Tax=Saccharicrinis sp. FJH54 TaxID=3344665 RepID=UPI0035D43FEF
MEERTNGGLENNNINPNINIKSDQLQSFRLDAQKLSVHDWLSDLPEAFQASDLVEVQFKNTRKGYFRNSAKLNLTIGDVVAVESTPGHDIGVITLMGELVKRQIRKNNIDTNRYEIKRVYRVAKPNDIEKWEKARSREHSTMIRSRQIAKDLGLDMKIGDVEFQGDGNKAIFYYIADGRVDFRQLIKVLAEEFRVRIEMKQIGARQEAGRIGGIGPCGRELCCSSWMSKFTSVSTAAARNQELSLNPQKLAGQCGKLKCCMNYELDNYLEARSELPDTNIPLETKDGKYYHQKTDVHKALLTYLSSGSKGPNMVTISADRVNEVIRMNKKGKMPDKLEAKATVEAVPEVGYDNVVGQDDLHRFDNNSRKKRRKPGRNKRNNRQNAQNKNRNNNQQN